MSDDRCREAFEKWAICEGFPVAKPTNRIGYYEPTNSAYLAWQARQPEIDRLRGIADAIAAKHAEKKAEGMPYIIPMAAKSKEHYRERQQGFLSGLLVAEQIARQIINGGSNENSMD